MKTLKTLASAAAAVVLAVGCTTPPESGVVTFRWYQPVSCSMTIVSTGNGVTYPSVSCRGPYHWVYVRDDEDGESVEFTVDEDVWEQCEEGDFWRVDKCGLS